MAIAQVDLNSLANNPTRGINLIINEVENSWNNGTIELNSKAHPAILCMDVTIATTHGLLNRLADACSKKFLLHARNVDDLSCNISDEERYGLFANPATSNIWFIADTASLKNIAVDAEEIDNQVTNTYKKVLIPKDTKISLGGYDFLIENGIEIRYNERTGYQVVYDATTNNPFNPITTNLLEREFKDTNGKRYIRVSIPVRQMSCTASERLSSTTGSGCTGSYTYTDYLYGVRAFLTDLNGNTQELRVSYDQDVFDPLKVTLALRLDTVNKRIAYEIPDVYIGNELGLGTVMIYTYTTKGELVKDFSGMDLTQYVPTYLDYRYTGNTLNEFSKALPKSGGIAWQFSDVVSGGSNPLPFTTMKEGIISGRRQRGIPITNLNLTGEVQNYGYGSVKTVDLLTGRRYSLTKELPVQTNKELYSTMNCFVGSNLTTVNQLIQSGVVYNNGQRITVPPGVLFDVSSPSTVMINALTKAQYLGLSNEAKVDLIAATALVYTPFYHVFDLTGNQTVLRTYHLDEPKFLHQSFSGENTNLGIEVGVGSININHTDTGYEIILVTQSGKDYKMLQNDEVGIQLYFSTPDSTRPACLAGEMIGVNEEQERIWRFKLNTNFDVDNNNVLYINGVNQFGQPKDNAGILLTDTLSFIFVIAADDTVPSTTMDSRIEPNIFNRSMMAVIETRYKTQFGAELTNIYSRIRPLKGSDQYQKYAYNVQAVHDKTTYQRNADGSLKLDSNKKPIIKFNQGDPKFTELGQPIWQYRAEVDYILDTNGNPKLKAAADLLYHWDFMAFDGAFYFSNDNYDKSFAQETKDYFVNVITKDMISFNSKALDRTAMYYQPKSKIGYRTVMINNNTETVLRQDLSFSIVYYLNNSGYNNTELKATLKETSPKVINKLLMSSYTLGMSDFTSVLRQDLSSDIVDVKINAMAGDSTIDVISNLDNTTGFCVRKLLETGSDNLLSIKEAIDTSFLEHDVTAVN